MPTTISLQIEDALTAVRDAYYQLVLIVGPARSGKTSVLSDLAKQRAWPRLNVNLRLSEKMMELTHRQRATRVAALLDDMVREEKAEAVLLDNIELIFSADLAQDPLRLLQSLARNRAIVAAWPGTFDGTSLAYAEAGHPEVRRYQSPQVKIIRADGADQGGPGSPGENKK